jgi:hypothetical protein
MAPSPTQQASKQIGKILEWFSPLTNFLLHFHESMLQIVNWLLDQMASSSRPFLCAE